MKPAMVMLSKTVAHVLKTRHVLSTWWGPCHCEILEPPEVLRLPRPSRSLVIRENEELIVRAAVPTTPLMTFRDHWWQGNYLVLKHHYVTISTCSTGDTLNDPSPEVIIRKPL